MILTILATIFFFLAFVIFLVRGYKHRNGWIQFIALNSFVNSLKETLPSNYNDIINIARIILGLLIIGVFVYRDFKNKPTANI